MPKVLAPFINYQRQSAPPTIHSHPLTFYYSPQLSVSTSRFLNLLAAPQGGEQGGGEKFK